MKIGKVLVLSLVFICLVLLAGEMFGAETKSGAAKSVKDLPLKYQKWLREDVDYIISKWERSVFMQLETDQEREMFIAAFWKNRDPNVYTEENEYKTEHYRRLKYVDDKFAKGTPTSGRRTEMGRIYIILGEPNAIERYESESEIYPVIIWFYSGMAQYGLPNGFSVVFFKENNAGDYELYSPLRHGPSKLLVNYKGDSHDIEAAYGELMKVIPNVARVSLSLIDGETMLGATPTVTSDLLLSKQIVESPTKRVNDEYAKKLLRYKSFIDVEYSVNYIPNKSKVKVVRDKGSGFYFVNYLIEPQKLSLEQLRDETFGNLEIHGNVYNKKGESVYQFTKNAPIRLEQAQMARVRDKSFSYQDFFPLMAGQYQMEILIRNTTSKEFTSIERELVVPGAGSTGVSMTVLANTLRSVPGLKTGDKAFVINGVQLLVSPQNDFLASDKMFFFFQVNGLSAAQRQEGSFVFTISKDEDEAKPLRTVKKRIAEYTGSDGLNFMEEFSLTGLPASYYVVRVAVLGASNQTLFSGEEPFFITPSTSLVRPWVMSMNTPVDGPEHLNTLAIQHTNIKDYDRAKEYMEQAFHRAPTSTKLALNYCQLLSQTRDYQKIKTICAPFMEGENKHEFYSYLGFACAALREYVEAIAHFKAHLAYYGTNIKILNAVGECYRQLGNKEEALIAWEKSLQLMPDQEQVKAQIKELKKSKTR